MVKLRNLEEIKDDLEAIRAEVEKINEKIAQAIRLRTKIVIKKDKAVEDYYESGAQLKEKYPSGLPSILHPSIPQAFNKAVLAQIKAAKEKNKQALLDLIRCLKNEKKIMGILDEGLIEGIKYLNDTLKIVRELKGGRELVDNIEFLLWILEYYCKNMEQIRSRIRLEEIFLESGKWEDFSKFNRMWEKELIYDAAVLKKLNPAKMEKMDAFFKKMGAIAKEVPGIAAAGGAAGGVVGFFGGLFTSGLLRGFKGAVDWDIIKYFALISAILSSIFFGYQGVIMGIREYELYLYGIQSKEAVKMRKVV